MTNEEQLQQVIGYYAWLEQELVAVQFKANEPYETVAQFKQRCHPDWAIETKDWVKPAV